jgi:hypothetical protein
MSVDRAIRRLRACESSGVLAALLACLALCVCAAAPALAAGAQFATEGEGAGQLGRAPSGIAVNQQSADVYIADGEETNNRADEFSATGEFLRSWGWGVSDGESEEFQICEAPGPCFSGLAGSGGGQFTLPHGAAVDNSAGLSQGNVYIGDPINHRVQEFGPEGEFILTFGGEVNATTTADVCLAGESCQAGTPGPGPSQFESIGRNAIAVGPTGTVYVGDVNRVQKFSSAGAPQGEVELPGAGAVELLAVDSSGELYVLSSELPGIRKYNGEGVEQGPVRDEGLGGSEPAITVGPNDELIISDPFKGRVLQFDPTGKQTGSFPVEPDASGGIALNNSTRALYVIHQHPSRVTIQTLPGPGPFILEGSERASEVLPTSATLNATINPEGPEETSYHFEYGTSEAYGQETAQTPLEGGEEGEFRDQPASAQITGLTPSTTYHFRAVATNALGQTTFGPDQTFQSLPPVSIESESVTAVTARSAKLLAELNPHGLPTEYHFEYGTSTAYGLSTPEAEAGKGSKAEVFSAQIEGLSPHTTYHYRVVARNELGVVQGPDQTFTTQREEAPSSIDGRGYEMVSPADKHGVSLEGLSQGVIQAAADGSGLAYIGLGPIDQEPAGSRSSNVSQLLAHRTGAGSWSTEDIATPHRAPAGVIVGNPSEYKLFSSDLGRGAVEPAGATPLSPLASEYTPYLRGADGSFTPLVYPGNVPAGTKFGGIENRPELFQGTVRFATGTPDLRHVLVHSPASLVQGLETAGKTSDYEWSEGRLTAVSLIPPPGADECRDITAACVSASEEGESEVGFKDSQMRGAISDDGNRVLFATSTHARLYLRDLARSETLRVDAAAPGVKPSEGNATFQWANSDGSKVFFTDDQKLTKDATPVSAEPDLYECEVVLEGEKLACRLSDLSVDTHPGEAADVLGTVIGADEAGRYVYFVAKGALEQGAAQGACPPAPGGGSAGEGQCVNLYVYDTVAQSRALVAVLSSEDFPDWSAGEAGAGTDLGRLTARVSPDGHYLAFMSERPLRGDDNRDAKSGARDEEVFLFHAENPGSEAGTLRCASCDPSGQRPVGVLDQSIPGPLVDRPEVWAGHWLAASLPGWVRVDEVHALHQPRYLSNSGRLYFNSPQSLVPADGNGTQDVYQFEPGGVGGCGEGSGCVSLISSGSSSEETALLDASESGDDVFFITAAQLWPTDEDAAFDIYDAHVCSLAPGCASPPGGSPPPCVSSDACRAAPAAQPDIFGAPASQTSSTTGNLAPPAGKHVVKHRLTRAQKLAKALKACRAKHNRHKRLACERAARKRYGAHRHHKKKGRGK